VHDSMLRYQMALPLDDSRGRFARARSLLDAGTTRCDDAHQLVSAVLADHGDPEHPICSHEDESLPHGQRMSTTASMVWDLGALTADVCAGPPCENARQLISLT